MISVSHVRRMKPFWTCLSCGKPAYTQCCDCGLGVCKEHKITLGENECFPASYCPGHGERRCKIWAEHKDPDGAVMDGFKNEGL